MKDNQRQFRCTSCLEILKTESDFNYCPNLECARNGLATFTYRYMTAEEAKNWLDKNKENQ